MQQQTTFAVRTKPKSDKIRWSGLVKIAFGILAVTGVLWIASKSSDADHIRYASVFIIGGLLGLTEILGRYTDSPIAALKSPGAFFYVLVNALASVLALYLLLTLAKDAVTNPISQVLVAGLGAMAFLRSSIFKVKIANEEVPVGPAIVLDTLLKFSDAQVDRERAEDRASRIAEVMKPLSLVQVGTDLPRLCFALMQNLPLDIRQRLLDDITLVVTDTKRSEVVKVIEIGLGLWSRVGLGTLIGAVALLGNADPAPRGMPVPAASGLVPPRPQGTPEDLLSEIEEQLAKDRQAVGA